MPPEMTFQPSLVLDSNAGDAAKNFPIALRIYSSTSDRTDLDRLRYKAFRDAGWIAENAQERFIDRYDGYDSTFAVGASHNGTCIGSLRLAFGGAGYAAKSMPCEELFSKEIHELNAAGGRRMVEFSRMAVDPSLTNRSFRTTLYASLIRAGLILSAAADVDTVLIAVHRNASAFYQAMCGFKIAGTSDAYLGIQEPTNFLSLEFSEIEARRRRVNTFFGYSAHEVHAARLVISALQNKAVA